MKKEHNMMQKIKDFATAEFTKRMVAVTSRATKKYGLKLNENGEAFDCEAVSFRVNCY